MQLSEEQIKEIAETCSDGTGDLMESTWSINAMIKFAHAIEVALRAQADARPVGFIEQWELDQLKAGCVARVFPTNDEPHDVAVYTHPEASAPGLSDNPLYVFAKECALGAYKESELADAATKALASASAATEATLAQLEAERRIDPAKLNMPLDAALRASAATVAEPTVVRGVRVCSISDIECTKQCGAICRHEATQQQAEPVKVYPQGVMGIPPYDPRATGLHKVTSSLTWNAQQAEHVEFGADCYVIKDASTGVLVGEQQAEPGADERAAFEAWYEADAMPSESNWFKRDSSDPTEYAWDLTQAAWEGWQAARAAQSGQRAGVAEEEK